MSTETNNWKSIYILGGIAGIGAVLVGIAEIGLTFLPNGNAPQVTPVEWFSLYQTAPFMALRNMGLINIFLNIFAIFLYLALYTAHRNTAQKSIAMLAMVIAFIGIGVFFANNRAFPMLALSRQYATATAAEKPLLEAAGQAMLTVGRSHTPGTFLGFALAEISGIIISFAMLRSQIFGKTAAYAGIIGFSTLLAYDFISAFVASLADIKSPIAMIGGLLSMTWYVLIVRKLFSEAK